MAGYPWFAFVDVHPVTVTKTADVSQNAVALALGGLAVASNVSSISQ
jgi:hypothetical protein